MLLLLFMASIRTVSAQGQASVALADADWLSVAKAALRLTSRMEAVTFVVDDGLSSEARHALGSVGNVVALAVVPDRSMAYSTPAYLRIFQFRLQGDRIEFLTGSVYPKVYQAGDCRHSSHIFLARTPNGEWKQDGPATVHVCSWH
ncbi:hypothetical protein [Massilia sp.]|uniref:hypothetical protein n=1 Tax=Massilia sp. TaxID=1882437 RepID=UPI00352F0708